MCGSCLGCCLLLPWWFWIEEPFTSLDDNFPVKPIDFAGKNSWVPFESDLLRYCAPWVHPSVSGALKIQASRVLLLRYPSWVFRRTVAQKTQGGHSAQIIQALTQEWGFFRQPLEAHCLVLTLVPSLGGQLCLSWFALPLRWTNVIILCSPSPLGTEVLHSASATRFSLCALPKVRQWELRGQ